MKILTQFNINDHIKVKLTRLGRIVHTEHYRKYLQNMPHFVPVEWLPDIDDEGFTRYQLHEFMNIFGEYMFVGAEQLFENNLIYFEQESLALEGEQKDVVR